jgi:hypothetical protein
MLSTVFTGSLGQPARLTRSLTAFFIKEDATELNLSAVVSPFLN